MQRLFPTHSTAAAAIAAVLLTGCATKERSFKDDFHAAGIHAPVSVYEDDASDREQPRGALFYFDGDGQEQALRPDDSDVVNGLVRAAAEHGMILVVPVTPDAESATWWRQSEQNAVWVRALIDSLVKEHSLDRGSLHLAGYSGGAQFIGQELLAERADTWMTGGGATLIGGGGPGMGFENPPSPELAAQLDVTWYVGSLDGEGASDPGWSALQDARKGAEAYREAGVESAKLVILEGVNHDYDNNVGIDVLTGCDLDRVY